MMPNFKEFIDKGHIYRSDEQDKFYCTYALMHRVCQVTALITVSGVIIVYGKHDHEPLFMQYQNRVDGLLAELKEKSVKSLFTSLKNKEKRRKLEAQKSRKGRKYHYSDHDIFVEMGQVCCQQKKWPIKNNLPDLELYANLYIRLPLVEMVTE
ncbi:GSCOCG00012494001-RA-CDS [Cotesia congregata]|nr:GSCOCG00012494001-RA-CDS [Cotesia congregata]